MDRYAYIALCAFFGLLTAWVGAKKDTEGVTFFFGFVTIILLMGLK